MKKLALLFALAVSAFATDVKTVVDVANSGVDQSTADMLVRDAVIGSGNTPVENSKYTLEVTLMSLGSSVIVIGEYQKKGEPISSAKLKAESPDELDVVIERVVRGALANESAEQNSEVGKIAESEEYEMLRRRGTLRYTTIGLGLGLWHPYDSDNGAEASLSYLLRYGYIWEASPHGAITLITNFGFNFEDNWSIQETFLIGGRYHITASSVSPYIGGGIGLGYSVFYGEDEFGRSEVYGGYGFAFAASAGIVFFRTSTTQLDVGINYDVVLGGFAFDEDASGKLGLYFAVNF